MRIFTRTDVTNLVWWSSEEEARQTEIVATLLYTFPPLQIKYRFKVLLFWIYTTLMGMRIEIT